MIELKNIVKKYKKNKKEKIALNNINLSFEEKGMYFITGKSGSGKSTLLNILAGIDTKFDGNMIVDGKDIKDFTRSDMNYYRGAYVGYVFQDYNLIPTLNVYDNVKLGADIAGIDDLSKIDEVFSHLGIDDLKDREVNELSGGESQRVAIARSLIKSPKVILCDEPTGALDKENAQMVMDTLYLISKESLVIVVTHDETFLSKYDSNNYAIENGKIENDINDIETINSFKSEKYKGASNKLKLKIGFEILFQKKISLLFSLLFIILATICFSVSVSCINYDLDSVIYKEINKEEYIVERFNFGWWKYSSEYACTDDDITSVSEVSDNLLCAYKIESISTKYDSNDAYLNVDKVRDLKYNENQTGIAFEYSKAKDFFDLKIINGLEPSNDNEIVISDVLADYFINHDYKFNNSVVIINNYSDLLGLNLFGYNISGIVKSKYSDKYRKDFSNIELDDFSFDKSKVDDDIYNGCANSIFTYKPLLKNSRVMLETSIDSYNDSYIYGKDIINIPENNEFYYFDENKKDGIIISMDYYCRKNYYMSFEEKIYDLYDNPSKNKEEIKNELIYDAMNQYYNSNVILNIMPEYSKNDKNYNKRLTTSVVGFDVSFNPESDLYISDDLISSNSFDISKTTNVDALFSKKQKDGDYKEYAYDLIDNLEDTKYNGKHILSNNKACDYLDDLDKFDNINTIFIVLGLIFLGISIFMLYRQINISISYKEKDLGVLKSTGVSNIDIFEILFIQNIFVGFVTIIFAFVLQYVGIYILNSITSNSFSYFIKSYSIDCFNYLSILILSILIPLFATLYTIIKFSKKSPKDILNNN